MLRLLSKLSFIVLALTLLSGCIAHKQYRLESVRCVVAADQPKSCENHALQSHAGSNGEKYLLDFIEFDDQGQLWDRKQMNAVVTDIDRIEGKSLIVMFVHGWKHSAAPGDRDIEKFRAVLGNLSRAAPGRQVVGVYLGWRGGSVSLPIIKQLTFWDRKNTAQKVGHGGMTEVLSRLELVQQTKNARHGPSNTRLVVVGHSFGGAVVYTALSQLLEDRFVRTQRQGGDQELSPAVGYGNLVVLINPAFEGMLFAPLSNMSAEQPAYSKAQLPVLAVLTSQGDRATKLAFPLGRRLSTLFERGERQLARRNGTTGEEEKIDSSDANVTAVGHFEPYRTHTLSPTDNRERSEIPVTSPQALYASSMEAGNTWAADSPGSRLTFGDLVLERTSTSAGRNPYIVASVDKRLIKHHNDIGDPRIIQFIEQLILLSSQSLQVTAPSSKEPQASLSTPVPPLPASESARSQTKLQLPPR